MKSASQALRLTASTVALVPLLPVIALYWLCAAISQEGHLQDQTVLN